MAVISEPETYSVAPPPSFSDVEVTPHDGYITMTINGVEFNLKTAASGYTVTLVGLQNYGSGTSSTFVKFGSAPSSANDYDSYCSFGTINGEVSYTNVTKAYVWCENKPTQTGYGMNTQTITNFTTSGYASAIELTITQDSTLYLQSVES